MSKRKRPATLSGRNPSASRSDGRSPAREPDGGRGGRGPLLLYGTHPVRAAIANPARRLLRLHATEAAADALADALPVDARRRLDAIETRRRDRADLDALAGHDAVHQGLVLEVAPLPVPRPEAIFGPEGDERPRLLAALDQVTDPRNVGAVLRSAALFGAAGVLLTERHAPPETGVLAKAAAGALDVVPVQRVGNLARTLEDAKAAGFWCLGLDADGDTAIDAPPPGPRLLLVLGAEGAGLRRLTRERCDMILSIPAPGAGPVLDSLNVSAAAAVALFQLSKVLRT